MMKFLVGLVPVSGLVVESSVSSLVESDKQPSGNQDDHPRQPPAPVKKDKGFDWDKFLKEFIGGEDDPHDHGKNLPSFAQTGASSLVQASYQRGGMTPDNQDLAEQQQQTAAWQPRGYMYDRQPEAFVYDPLGLSMAGQFIKLFGQAVKKDLEENGPRLPDPGPEDDWSPFL